MTGERSDHEHRTHHHRQFCYDGFYNRDRLAALLDTLDGVTITDAERRTLAWLSGWEKRTIENLAALITRARQSGPPA